MYILGLFIVPMIYFIRDEIRTLKIRLLWYFLNDTTKQNESDVDWGDYGRYERNFWGYFKQCALRNSHWNFRHYVLAFDEFTPTEANIIWSNVYDRYTKQKLPFKMMLCNVNNYWGSQLCFYKANEIPLFRFSFTIPIFNRVWNVQFGEGSNRYLYKCKFSKI